MGMNRIQCFEPNLLAVCGGALSAALALCPLSFGAISFFVTYFAPAPLFFVGMCWGVRRLFIGACVALGIFSMGAGIHSGLVFLVITLVPAFLIVYRFQKGDSVGYIISWVVGLAMGIFLVTLLILSAQSMNVLDLLHSWFSFFINDQTFKGFHRYMVCLLPGISSISWVIACFMNASIAQKLAVKAQLAQRPYPLLGKVQLYENWDIVLAFGLLLVVIDIPLFAFIGKNIALMSCIPIFLVGLRVVYVWLRQFENPQVWVVAIALVSFFLVWPMVFIVILGVLEPTVRLGQKWTLHKS